MGFVCSHPLNLCVLRFTATVQVLSKELPAREFEGRNTPNESGFIGSESSLRIIMDISIRKWFLGCKQPSPLAKKHLFLTPVPFANSQSKFMLHGTRLGRKYLYRVGDAWQLQLGLQWKAGC